MSLSKIPKFGEDKGVDSEEMLERFYREARAAATLRSPNICPVYDVGEIDGQHYNHDGLYRRTSAPRLYQVEKSLTLRNRSSPRFASWHLGWQKRMRLVWFTAT